jgi:hypothetical protein
MIHSFSLIAFTDLRQLCDLKDNSNSDFKMKNMIGDGMKTFRKYRRLAINAEFLLAFYKSNSQM